MAHFIFSHKDATYDFVRYIDSKTERKTNAYIQIYPDYWSRIPYTGVSAGLIEGKSVRLIVGGNAIHLSNEAAENHMN